MLAIRIRLIGEVAFRNTFDTSSGYRYDVPLSTEGLPYIPMNLLAKEGLSGIKTGFAHPAGYMGLLHSANELRSLMDNSAHRIADFFTKTRFAWDRKYRTRSLKAGQIFFAPLSCDPEKLNRIEKLLREIRQIGVVEGSITGAVECSLADISDMAQALSIFARGEYCALDYSLMVLTPLCLYAPYGEGCKTNTFVPGSVIRKELLEKVLGKGAGKFSASNAYLSDGTRRLLPVPLCASVVKLDKEQLRYRLAAGKDIDTTEPVVNLSNAYADDFESQTMRYAVPKVARIVSGSGELHDAIASGQIFSGTVYGSDAELRKLADYMAKHPLSNIGYLAEEGFGEVLGKVTRLRERKPKAEILARSFDVACLADTLLLNGEGMPAYGVRDFLAEIAQRLGVSGDYLAQEGSYIDANLDFSQNLRWGTDGAVVRCMKTGSVVRIRTKDGTPVDISPIMHTFIGERNTDGYGEIMSYPARGTYYRTAQQVQLQKFSLPLPLTLRDNYFKVKLIHSVMASLLEERVKNLGVVDRDDFLNGAEVEDMVLVELLNVMRDTYDPSIPMERLVEWYYAGMEEAMKDAWDFSEKSTE